MKSSPIFSSLIFPFLILTIITFTCPAENLLESFYGGMQDISLLYSGSVLNGIGIYQAGAGVGITTLRPTPASIYWNPAGLAFLRKSGILLEACPQLSYSPDISGTVNNQVDNALDRIDQDPNTTIIYPEATFTGGQSTQSISSLALAFPFRKNYFALSYYQAFSLEMQMLVAGIENKISTQEENPNDNATIYTRTNMNLFLDFNADVVSLAWARKLGSKFGAGLTLSRINSNTSINGLLAPEGIFTRRGIEKSFNDPGAGWQNDFYSSMNGDFAGGAWGMKTGFAYQPNDRFCLNLLMNYPGNMTLNGEMEIIQYFYPALNLNADEAAGEEIFNLDNIQNFAQPTETVLADNQPSNQLTINLPRSIALGVAYRGISFTLSAYSGELSYAYDLARDGNWVTYSRGLKPKFGFLLGFDIKYLQLSLGAIAVDEVVSGYLDSENKPIEPMSGIYIPRFNLSTGFRVAQNWRTEVLLLSSPDLLGSVLKVGATYSFE